MAGEVECTAGPCWSDQYLRGGWDNETNRRMTPEPEKDARLGAPNSHITAAPRRKRIVYVAAVGRRVTS
jgi:hypothetical protein